MIYRKLLFPLSDTSCGRAAEALAIRLAIQWQAHLAAIVTRVDAASVAPLTGEGLSGGMIEDMMEATEREAALRAGRLEKRFRDAAASAGLGAAPGQGGAAASVQVLTGQEEDLVPPQARLADLTILPHPTEVQEDPTAGACLHAVLFESGRPVLIAPPTAPATLGRRCCVAWNGTTESASALWAMLPWLQAADAVRVLHAAEYQRRGPLAPEVLEYLSLHGVRADLAEFHPINRDVGAGLLAAAHDFRADLLGMGAYSHSRLRQLILGGVTRHILTNAGLPVLMAR